MNEQIINEAAEVIAEEAPVVVEKAAKAVFSKGQMIAGCVASFVAGGVAMFGGLKLRKHIAEKEKAEQLADEEFINDINDDVDVDETTK